MLLRDAFAAAARTAGRLNEASPSAGVYIS